MHAIGPLASLVRQRLMLERRLGLQLSCLAELPADCAIAADPYNLNALFNAGEHVCATRTRDSPHARQGSNPQDEFETLQREEENYKIKAASGKRLRQQK